MKYRFQALAFCPQCGAKYEVDNFDPAAAVFLCQSCGYDFYQHSAPSAVSVVRWFDMQTGARAGLWHAPAARGL